MLRKKQENCQHIQIGIFSRTKFLKQVQKTALVPMEIIGSLTELQKATDHLKVLYRNNSQQIREKKFLPFFLQSLSLLKYYQIHLMD